MSIENGFRIWIPKRCKGVHCVDLGESFPTHIFLQNLASIQRRTSLVKFARSPRTDPPGIATTSCRRSSWSSACRSRSPLSRRAWNFGAQKDPDRRWPRSSKPKLEEVGLQEVALAMCGRFRLRCATERDVGSSHRASHQFSCRKMRDGF